MNAHLATKANDDQERLMVKAHRNVGFLRFGGFLLIVVV